MLRSESSLYEYGTKTKYIFIINSGTVIEIEAESKQEAIDTFAASFEMLFERNWKVYKVDVSLEKI